MPHQEYTSLTKEQQRNLPGKLDKTTKQLTFKAKRGEKMYFRKFRAY